MNEAIIRIVESKGRMIKNEEFKLLRGFAS